MFAQKEFLYYLGVATLFVFAIYFAYAVLKGSGEGIQKILGDINVKEGFRPKQLSSTAENLEAEIEKATKMPHVKSMINGDNAEGFDELKDEVVKLFKINREASKWRIFNVIVSNKGKNIKLHDKQMQDEFDKLIKINNVIKILEENDDYDI